VHDKPWQRNTSPAAPVACATGRHRTDGRQNSASDSVPASPYGARNSGTYRCEPQTSRVGASSMPTSVNRNRASSPRGSESVTCEADDANVASISLLTGLGARRYGGSVEIVRPHAAC